MSNNELFSYQNIIKNMSEGVLSLAMNGKVDTINTAALSILGLTEQEVIGKPFASLFFKYSENDAFNQTILDAIYENSTSHNSTVDYFDGKNTKKLFVNTSFLINEGEKIGVAAVLNDITELVELQDAVLAMERIKALNADLEKRNEFIKKTFGRYLTDDIVNTILNSDDGLVIGGKKREVTIMFTDIRGFTALAEGMPPDDLIKMLNNYLADMTDIINKYKGTILEFIGDAIVVVFGAPLEDDERDCNAVRCAIEMQCAMTKVNNHNVENGYPEIEMGIGIHTGDAILGNIGSEKKTKYDIIGKNVNLASRVETFTVGGQILISPSTKEILGDKVKTRGEFEILPKGVKKPITIYDVESCEDVKMPDNTQVFIPLDKPLDLDIQIIEGKFASEETIPVTVRELSKKQAKCTAAAEFQKNTNIKFLHGKDEIYAKIIEAHNGGFTMHFTKGTL